MKDFYDLDIVSQRFSFFGNILKDALLNTFHRRKTKVPNTMPVSLTDKYYTDEEVFKRWKAFSSRVQPNVKPDMEGMIFRLQSFYASYYQHKQQNAFDYEWTPGNGWEPQKNNNQNTFGFFGLP